MNKLIFVTGIGTNVGKSYATGWLANILLAEGKSVITQKMIQTGNDEFSEDIDVHRKIMGMEYCDDDKNHLTAPMIFSYPASPHLAAKIDKKDINLEIIENATNRLLAKYNVVLLEGAGGLMVPIKDDYLTIDYITDKQYSVALVTNGTLGSINHTLLSLYLLEKRKINVEYVIYNAFFDEDNIICNDTVNYIKNYVQQHYKNAKFLLMPSLKTL
ncbi:MAG: dethiobiotin synthase [Muribaculaceae bacterium]